MFVFGGLSAIASCTSVGVVHGEQAGNPVEKPIDSLMMSFSRSMRGIEKGMQAELPEAVAEHALALSRSAEGVDVVEFPIETSMDRTTFGSHLEQTEWIAMRIAVAAGEGNLLAASQAHLA